ncbi:hypothetical protein B0H14DRAFT_3508885 [Mycena olivaceomarginata]|nr:hypothetical protein B0H14DRAFT_3508885 [Mycena olivaceomarginata]
MARTTTFIIGIPCRPPSSTSPFPFISAPPGLDAADGHNEKAKFHFRNTGSTLPFHVGGAEFTVAPGGPRDYATVVPAGIDEAESRLYDDLVLDASPIDPRPTKTIIHSIQRVYDCVIKTQEGTGTHAHKRYSDFVRLETKLLRFLPRAFRPCVPELLPKGPLARYRAAFLARRCRALEH